ncbi:DNA-processing protein DprA [Desulfotomaculum sp. 1211_IL3151]|uniref:DNA-processing protein DprA n=1 Tax=Desulfotomaculum sp. 1211_IL3151 TaxID=3084055 RepID=UPI002FD93374
MGILEKRLYWVGWQTLLPGSGRRVWDIINHFGSPATAWQASEKDLQEVLGNQGARKLVQRRSTIKFDKLGKLLGEMNGKVITIEDDNYPYLLKSIHDPPLAIFVRGNLPSIHDVCLAMVGSRKPSPNGLVITEKLSSELAMEGITIVSGLARGIDSAAHRGALNGKGVTLAVLGCGPDVVYPRENARLMQQIIEKGAIITEFPPGTLPQPWHFPSRNRIISGLSNAVLVVEAAAKSGALITADFALEQGREVMAVPGNINNAKSMGTNKLIQQGAALIINTLDILNELGMKQKFSYQAEDRLKSVDLTDNESKILALLSEMPITLEKIISLSMLAPKEVAVALTLLEIKGLIKCLSGKMYIDARL